MNTEIEKIIVKFLTNNANQEDLNKLDDWLKIKDNVQLLNHFIETNYALDINMIEFDSKGVKKTLAEKIKHDKNVFYKFKVYKVLKYAAVAVIVFGLGYFFQYSGFNTRIENSPTAVNTNTIIPGTDKAILTLEDGTVVALEKGTFFQTKNANSNGEKLIYKSGERPSKDLIYNYLTIPRGGQFFIKLEDGTQVWLNSESQLKYPVSFITGEKRHVELIYGEAYFDVSPSENHNGSKFVLSNKSQEIEVLGTEFNVKAYQDELNVYTTLIEGKVNVNYFNSTQTLKPNQQAILNPLNNSISIEEVDVYTEVSWKDGVFSFERKNLKEVMMVLSRWYDFQIQFENRSIEGEEFGGILRKDRDIEEVLISLKNYGFIEDYELIQDKKMIILK